MFNLSERPIERGSARRSRLRWKRPHLHEKRLSLGRFRWETYPGGRECSHEVSLRLYLELRDLWVGLYWEHNEFERWCFYLCLIPCLPLRIKFLRSWGGRFP